MNKATLSRIRELNANSTTNYHYIPKLHPRLDEKQELERLVSEPETVAIKIHGIATHTSPSDIPQWAVDISNEKDVPFYIHTDYLHPIRGNKVPDELQSIISKNTPELWINWAKEKGVNKLHLSHLLRLDYESAKVVNSLDNIIVGIGPSLLLQNEPSRLKENTENIIKDSLKIFDSSKLVYSTDFAWNVSNREAWSAYDWKASDRIIAEARRDGFSDKKIKNIFSENAKNFFKL